MQLPLLPPWLPDREKGCSTSYSSQLKFDTYINTKWCKKNQMKNYWNFAHWHSSESTQWKLSNEYQHDRDLMVFPWMKLVFGHLRFSKKKMSNCFWLKVASALKSAQHLKDFYPLNLKHNFRTSSQKKYPTQSCQLQLQTCCHGECPGQPSCVDKQRLKG